MKNLKKILALVLAFACAFTMFAVAGAADFTDKASIKNYEAVNTLVALNILKGRDNGSFDPDATVNRAEMAKMIYVIWNGGKEDATAYETMKPIFNDLDKYEETKWAKGYINFCAANNIVAGMGDGSFAPNQTVTGQQAAKMLLVLMGYDDEHAGLTGPKWAQNTMSYAGLAGLFKNIESPVEQGLPRQYAAQMVYNTLEAYRVKWSSDNNAFDEITKWSGSNFEKETVGSKYMNYETITGILVEARNGDEKGFSILQAGNTNHYSWNRTSTADKDEWNKNLWVETKYATDLSEYLGQEVKVSYNAEEFSKNRDSVYGVYSTDNNTVVTTTANKIADAKENGKIKLDGTKYKIDDNIRYFYSTVVDGHSTDLTSDYFLSGADDSQHRLGNVFGGATPIEVKDNKGNVTKYPLYADYEPFVANTVKFVDYDKDGKFDVAIDYPMAVAEVSMVSTSTISVKDIRGVDLTTSSPKREDVIAYDGIAKGDIVQITWDTFKDKAKFTKLTTTDETIGSVRNGINKENEEFNISTGWVKRYANSVTKSVNNKDTVVTGAMGVNSIDTKLKSGDKATFVIIGGIAYYVDRTQSGTGNDVAVVVSTGSTYDGGADGGDVEAKLMFADGTTSRVTVKSIIDNASNTKYDLDAKGFRTAIGSSASNAKDLELLNYYLSNKVSYNSDTKKWTYATFNATDCKSYSDLLSATTGNIAPALVTYSRSGNDYTLQLLDKEENDAGYDDVITDAKWDKTTTSGDAKVDGYNLLDDGTVFVVYDRSVKRYTGSQAKKLATGTDYDLKNKAYALVEKSNGVSRVRVAAIYAGDKPTISGVGNYAYLLDTTSSKTIDGTSYIILTAYTKNGAETLYVEDSSSERTKYEKGDVVDFSYTNSNITDNGTEYKLVADVNDPGAQLSAVTGWDRNDISVLVGSDATGGSFIKNLDVDTDDTTVLVVDTDGKVGISVGKDGIQVANSPRKENGQDVYYVNAKVVYGTEKYFDLIVIDSLNNWLDKDWELSKGVKFDKNPQINQGGDSKTPVADAAQKKVDDGRILTMSDLNEIESGAVVTIGPKTQDIDFGQDINVVKRAAVNFNYNYTVTNDVATVNLTTKEFDLRALRGTNSSSKLSIKGQLPIIPIYNANGQKIQDYNPNENVSVKLYDGVSYTLAKLNGATFYWNNNTWVLEK